MSNYTVPSNGTTDHNTLSSWKKVLLAFLSTTMLAYIVFTVVALINLFVNLRVIYKVCSSLHGQRMRHVSLRLLILQVSIISLGITIVSMYQAMKQLDFVHYQIQFRCGHIDFIRIALICALPINMAAIFFDAARNFDQYRIISDLLIYRLLLLVWIPAIFQGLPYILLEYEDFEGSHGCILVPSIGNSILFTLFEMIKFILFDVGVTIYMINVLLIIRSKLRSLHCRLPNARRWLENQILTTRFLCIHLATFIILWVPLGLLSLIIRIFKRLQILEDKSTTGNESLYTNLILFTYLIIHSNISLTFLENKMGFWPEWCHCWFVCLPRRTFRDNELQRAHADIIRPSMGRTREREEQNIVSSSQRVSGVLPAYDITSATSMHYSKRQETVSMIDIVDLTRRASGESREISSENSTSQEASDGLLKETFV